MKGTEMTMPDPKEKLEEDIRMLQSVADHVARNDSPRCAADLRNLAERLLLTWTCKPAEQVAGAEVDDLAMLIRQLVRALSKASPDSQLIARTMDYLRRKDLQGSPLRTFGDRMRDANATKPFPSKKGN